MKVTFVKKLALDRFLRRIDDVIVREEVLELFKKIGKQGAPTEEDVNTIKELLERSEIPYKDFEDLCKTFRRS